MTRSILMVVVSAALLSGCAGGTKWDNATKEEVQIEDAEVFTTWVQTGPLQYDFRLFRRGQWTRPFDPILDMERSKLAAETVMLRFCKDRHNVNITQAMVDPINVHSILVRVVCEDRKVPSAANQGGVNITVNSPVTVTMPPPSIAAPVTVTNDHAAPPAGTKAATTQTDQPPPQPPKE